MNLRCSPFVFPTNFSRTVCRFCPATTWQPFLWFFLYLRPGFDGTPCTEPNWMGLLLQGTVALDGCACWTLYNLLWLPLSCRLSFLYFLLPSYFFFCCRVSIIFGRKKCSSDPSTQKKVAIFPTRKEVNLRIVFLSEESCFAFTQVAQLVSHSVQESG